MVERMTSTNAQDSVWPVQHFVPEVHGYAKCIVAVAFDDMSAILDQLLAPLVLVFDQVQGAKLHVDAVGSCLEARCCAVVERHSLLRLSGLI